MRSNSYRPAPKSECNMGLNLLLLAYALECWTLLLRFYRKILKTIVGPVREGLTLRQRKNCELEQLYKDADLVRSMKIVGSGTCCQDAQNAKTMPKKLLGERIFSKGKMWRPKMSDDIPNDARSLLGVMNSVQKEWWVVASCRRRIAEYLFVFIHRFI